uniref:POR n=1 Tax=Ursus americanus TaxID=9643 RepID=A0A452QYB9_URSAM
MGDSSMDASATMSETVAEEVSLFSMTDMILFSLIVGVLSYWLLFRKKKDEIPEFTKIQPLRSSNMTADIQRTQKGVLGLARRTHSRWDTGAWA